MSIRVPVFLILLLSGLAGLAGLAGCSQVAQKAEAAANRSFTSYALGRPYAEVASIGTSPLERLSGSDRATFGPLLGATRLANGMTIYRHMAPSARTETGTDFAGLVGTSSVRSNNRLSYFLVGPDGIVRDWATGSVPGDASSCITYIGGIIERCSDLMQYEASLTLYDARVQTKDGRPISAWGEPLPTAGQAIAAGMPRR
ncbi:hypothetical protein [Rhizobium sp. SSA_523]|uniref:hypothetical protein n=1 Tax=Rhizobium sp. SSA_523 TaxID=2952477 RepID=UPI002091DCD7|nr:hypothetical protein [Rhizobium sp. SSA_523]MCO5732083.1 hypothetical protein [Rhizobium sp. SSA_523]WKC22580.1 hypothetical protein QTJ18_17105 [Rhizobium sp. SSA_523]